MDVYDDFEYVVQKPEKQKICFGSICPRDMSKKGMSPFMRYYTLENHSNVSPCSYNPSEAFKAVKNKPCLGSISKKGYGGIARYGGEIVSAYEYPSPATYKVGSFITKINETKYPFDSTGKRDSKIVDKNPGPGTYRMFGKQEMSFEHSFGGRAKMRLGVDLKCCSRNKDTCNVCKNKPDGDYWHWNNKVFLCRPCMARERSRKSKDKGRELNSFRRVRDCSTIHHHEDTNAKMWLRHPAEITKWNRKEAYLSLYLRD